MGLKARIRAWLVDLVREAMRQELKEWRNVDISALPKLSVPVSAEAVRNAIKTAQADIYLLLDPTFEQMQSESIAQQEKYYAPLNP